MFVLTVCVWLSMFTPVSSVILGMRCSNPLVWTSDVLGGYVGWVFFLSKIQA